MLLRERARNQKTALKTAGNWRALCQCHQSLATPVAMSAIEKNVAKTRPSNGFCIDFQIK